MMDLGLRVFKWFRQVLLIAVIGISICVSAFAQGIERASAGISMVPVYGVTAMVSLLLLMTFILFLRGKERWLLVLFVSVFVTNLGYFLLAISGTLGEAMLANRISYLGSVLLPLCMLMIIMDLCGLYPHKAMTGVLVGVAALVFLLAASGGYSQLYYKEVTMEIVNGAATLHKEYGPLHQVYFIYLIAYLVTMIAVIIFAARKKDGPMRKYAPVMCTVVLLNIAVWFAEQHIHWDFEFLSVSYIVSELLLLFLCDIVQEHAADYSVQPAEDMGNLYPMLTNRELDVLKLILENKKRKEIAEELFVTENTVKKHTAHIYEKLGVSDRSELLLKIGKKLM